MLNYFICLVAKYFFTRKVGHPENCLKFKMPKIIDVI